MRIERYVIHRAMLSAASLCAPIPAISCLAQSPPLLAGDLDGDGIVSLGEIDTLFNSFSSPATDPLFDIDGDGDADFADFKIAAAEYAFGTGRAFTVLPDDRPIQRYVSHEVVLVDQGGEIQSGSQLESGAVVYVVDGTIGFSSRSYSGSLVTIAGGSIQSEFKAIGGSTLKITGGSVGDRMEVQGGSSVIVDGGTVGDNIQLFSGSTMHVSGGSIGNSFRGFDSNITVSISGGSVGQGFTSLGTLALSGGTLGPGFASIGPTTIVGGEFEVDRQPSTGLPGGLVSARLLSGTLADGSVFILSRNSGDFLGSSTTLQTVDLPPADTTPMSLTTGSGPSRGLRPGQQLTLSGDATLRDDFAAVDATLYIEGGAIGQRLEIAGSEVTITGGAVGDSFTAYSGSIVNVSGGSVGRGFSIHSETTLTVTGGIIGSNFFASAGSSARFTGGSIGNSFRAGTGSAIEFEGGEFQLNGSAITDLNGGLGDGDVFTGTLLDGSVIILADDEASAIAADTAILSVVALPAADTTPINLTTGPASNKGLRAGQTLNLSGDATLPHNFAAVNATLNIAGGTAGDSLEIIGTRLHVSGGTVGPRLNAYRYSSVTVTGGEVGERFSARKGSAVTLSGGRVGQLFTAGSGSTVVISSGVVIESMTALDGSRVTISGGKFVDGLEARTGSVVTLVGAEFAIDGEATSVIEGPGLQGVITGTLADGTVVIFPRESAILDGSSYFAPGTTTLQVVSLPPADTMPLTLVTGSGPSAGLRPGQTLTLRGDATLPDYFAAVDATLTIDGGTVGKRLQVAGSTVAITGGLVTERFDVFLDSEVVIAGGQVNGLNAFRSSTVNITGGSVTGRTEGTVRVSGGIVSNFIANASLIDIAGGLIGPSFNVNNGWLRISGGTIAPGLKISAAQTTIAGGEFQVNGTSVNELTSGLNYTGVFTGTLADGSVFILSTLKNDRVTAGITTLEQVGLPAADLTPMIVSSGKGPDQGLRKGQELTLTGDATLRDYFAVVDATLNIEGGSVGRNLQVAGSTLNMSGGMVGEGLYIFTGSTLNFSGGEIGHGVIIQDGASVNIFGAGFTINGIPITGLSNGEKHIVAARDNAVLTGFLANGTPLRYQLSSFSTAGDWSFQTDAQLTVSLQLPTLLGDTDLDGDVDDHDLNIALMNYTGPVGGSSLLIFTDGDTDNDGDVDDADLGTLFAAYTGALTISVPEPTSLGLLAVGTLLLVRRRLISRTDIG